MKFYGIAIVFLLAAASPTPAFANWYDNFLVGEGHKKLVGSAPTPTPDDLRAIGDSSRGDGKSYHFDPKGGHWHEVGADPEAIHKASVPDAPQPDSTATARAAPALPIKN